MDGPIGASGYEAGGAFVTIGADLSGLRAAEAEAQQILERIGRMSASAGIPSAGGGGPLSAVHAAQAQVDAIRAAGGVPAIGNPAFAAPPAGAAGGGPTPSFGAGAGGTGGASPYRFGRGLTGLAANFLGVPLVSIIAAEAALHLGAGYAEAAEIEAHPERVLRGLSSVGSGFDPFGSPSALATAGNIVSQQADLRRMQALESLPLLGNLFGIQQAPRRAALEDSIALGERNLQGLRFLDQTEMRLGVSAAELSGNPLEIARAEARAREHPLEVESSRDIRALFGNKAQMLAPEYAEFKEAQRQQKQAATDLAEMQRQDQIKIGVAEGQFSARLGGLSATTAGNLGMAAAITQLAARAPGSSMAALLASQSAERGSFVAATDEMLAGINDPEQLARTAAMRMSGFNLLGARQGLARANLSDDIRAEGIQMRARGEAAAAMAAHDPFAARFAEFNAQFEIGLPRAHDNLSTFLMSATQERQALFSEQSQSGALAFASAQANVSAANARLRRDTLGERLAGFGPMEVAAGFLPSVQQGMALAQINAQRQATIGEDQRHQFMLKEEYTARSAAAQAVINDQPINAQAIAHVAAATLEVQQADPRNRAQAVATAQNELRAAEHRLIGQRGGLVGIDQSFSQALGDLNLLGLDLTGRRADQLAAAGTFRKGINDLPSTAGAADQTVSDPQLLEAVKTLATWLEKIYNKSGSALFD